MVSTALLDSLRKHEGWRDKAYQDSEGIWTVGYGTNLQELTINKGVGERWLVLAAEAAEEYAKRFPEWNLLNTTRREVFTEMIYNMGPSRVARFKNTLAAIRAENWAEAAKEMLDSKWARQVGIRAVRLSTLMEDGYYKGND